MYAASIISSPLFASCCSRATKNARCVVCTLQATSSGGTDNVTHIKYTFNSCFDTILCRAGPRDCVHSHTLTNAATCTRTFACVACTAIAKCWMRRHGSCVHVTQPKRVAERLSM